MQIILAPMLAGAMALTGGTAPAQEKQSYNQYTLCAAAADMLRDVSGATPKGEHYGKEARRNYDQAVAVLTSGGASAADAKAKVDNLFERGTALFKEDIVGSFTPMLGSCKNLGLLKMWE
ncbi:MAG: hypothetical protein EOP60_01300 [Sphingomonadales bacterium]|nr:MAG: hypothetical protein EOP60_01300 [Sphingomonadales bacterium]